jgi:hypothetical protein
LPACERSPPFQLASGLASLSLCVGWEFGSFVVNAAVLTLGQLASAFRFSYPGPSSLFFRLFYLRSKILAPIARSLDFIEQG